MSLCCPVTTFRSLSRELYRQTRGTSGHSAESRKTFEQRDVCYTNNLSLIRLVLPEMVLLSWCRLTQVVLEKRPLNKCSSSSTSISLVFSCTVISSLHVRGVYYTVSGKKSTNNVLGITLTKFNKFPQFLAQFMLTCQLTKKL